MISGVSSSSGYTNTFRTSSMKQGGQEKGDFFSKVDSDGDKKISQSELDVLAKGIAEVTGNSVDSEEALKTFDTDGDGALSDGELRGFMKESGIQGPPGGMPPMFESEEFSPPQVSMNQAVSAYGGGGPGNDLDTDGDGKISQPELDVLAADIQEMTGRTIDTEEALSTYDTDEDGALGKDEMHAFMDESGIAGPSGPPPPPPRGGMSGMLSTSEADDSEDSTGTSFDFSSLKSSLQQALTAYQTNSGTDQMAQLMSFLEQYSSSGTTSISATA